MSEMTNRQWRALAQALPYYITPTASSTQSGEAVDNACSTHDTPSRGDFALYVVHRIVKAFPAEVKVWREDPAVSGAESPTTVDAVEGILTHVFGRPACFSNAAAVTSTPARTCSLLPLTMREVQLLGLYYRRQEQYAYVHDTQQRLHGAAQAAVHALKSALQSSAAREAAEEEACGLLDSTRESLQWLGGPPNVVTAALRPSPHPAAAAHEGFTSALANMPYNGFATHADNDDALASTCSSFAGAIGQSHSVGVSTGVSPALMVVNRCAGCGEVGGDLLVCTQCGEVRHEACGGPHPPERSKVDGSLPTMNVCRRCARELNLSTSSSSLCSSTSSSERAALDEYFDSDDDSDSSLSGFVVHSSEEDGEEEDGEEEDGSGSRGSSPTATNKHRREEQSRTQRRHRRSERSSTDGSDSDKEEKHARRGGKRQRREETRPRRVPTPPSSKRKGSSGREDEASSSSVSSSAPAARRSPPPPTPSREHTTETPSKQRTTPTRQSKRGKTSPPSTQQKRQLLDEEDELAMLGIRAAPSATASPQHIKKKKERVSSLSKASASAASLVPSKEAKRKRPAVMNLASSSSSSRGSDSD